MRRGNLLRDCRFYKIDLRTQPSYIVAALPKWSDIMLKKPPPVTTRLEKSTSIPRFYILFWFYGIHSHIYILHSLFKIIIRVHFRYTYKIRLILKDRRLYLHAFFFIKNTFRN